MGYYADLIGDAGPWVTFERCVERGLAEVFRHFAEDFGSGEPLSGVTVHEGTRGLPMVFGGWNTKDGAETFDEVKDAASHVLLVAHAREDMEGDEQCELSVVVAVAVHDGDPEDQLEKFEAWVAAARGILSTAMQEHGGVLTLANAHEARAVLKGIVRKEGPSEFDFSGGRWISTERYQVTGYRTDGGS